MGVDDYRVALVSSGGRVDLLFLPCGRGGGDSLTLVNTGNNNDIYQKLIIHFIIVIVITIIIIIIDTY